jgi:hypothetical protein
MRMKSDSVYKQESEEVPTAAFVAVDEDGEKEVVE